MRDKLHYETWIQQPLLWGERVRGRSLAWMAESSWFINDPLGHMPHSHEDATELAFLAQGTMEIEVGGSKRVYHAGDLLLMPPHKFHDYWFKGEDPVCLFVAVAPNHKDRRWRTSDFPPEAHEGDAPHANVFETDELPSNQHFQCDKVTLMPGESDPITNLSLQDRIIYILNGMAQIRVDALTGSLAPHQYFHIPATYAHEIRNTSYHPLTYISMIVTDPATAKGTELEQ